MENKHYEYKVIQRSSLEGAEDILNMYGNLGWELVGYSSDAVYANSIIRQYQFILKREI
jgi:hypothetical protein